MSVSGRTAIAGVGATAQGTLSGRTALDLGAEAFKRKLDEVGVNDYFYELFDATHSGIEYRYPQAIAYLAERLS